MPAKAWNLRMNPLAAARNLHLLNDLGCFGPKRSVACFSVAEQLKTLVTDIEKRYTRVALADGREMKFGCFVECSLLVHLPVLRACRRRFWLPSEIGCSTHLREARSRRLKYFNIFQSVRQCVQINSFFFKKLTCCSFFSKFVPFFIITFCHKHASQREVSFGRQGFSTGALFRALIPPRASPRASSADFRMWAATQLRV